MKKFVSMMAALVCLGSAVAPNANGLSFSIGINDQPYYVHGPGYWAGRVYYVWVPGHHAWRRGHRVWVHGHYAPR
ncbi:MAG: hypothetical protein QOG48_2247 [Verrucomicrobiota bacterium]|jgi:hypothetical protein